MRRKIEKEFRGEIDIRFSVLDQKGHAGLMFASDFCVLKSRLGQLTN